MCVNGRWVYNSYIGKHIYVPCGRCVSCQLERSARSYARIKNHERDKNYFRVFVTLNYNNDCLPYIDLKHYDGTRTLKVYRNVRVYYYRNRYMRFPVRCVKRGRHLVTELSVSEHAMRHGHNTEYDGLLSPQKFKSDTCIGVCLTKDFADFLKRFRQNIYRHYGLKTEGLLSYYRVAEYGPTTLRPHFHVILYFPKEWSQYYVQIKRALITSWPFCSLEQLLRNVAPALEGQQYVSRYCCRPSTFPQFLTIRSISPKGSFSRGYGFGDTHFTASSVFTSALTRDFKYTYSFVTKKGERCVVDAHFPQYFVRRYFPRIKGSYLLDRDAFFSILSNPRRIYAYADYLGMIGKESMYYYNRIVRATSLLGISGYDYANLYMSYMSGLTCSHIKSLYMSFRPGIDTWSQWYDNLNDLLLDRHYVDYFCVSGSIVEHLDFRYVDPNTYPIRLLGYSNDFQEFCSHVKKSKFNERVWGFNFKYITHILKNRSYVKKHSQKASPSCIPRASSA